MHTFKDMRTGTQTGKLTGTHTCTHTPPPRAHLSSYRNTYTVCSTRHMGTQRQVHPLLPAPQHPHTHTVYIWACTLAEEEVRPCYAWGPI